LDAHDVKGLKLLAIDPGGPVGGFTGSAGAGFTGSTGACLGAEVSHALGGAAGLTQSVLAAAAAELEAGSPITEESFDVVLSTADIAADTDEVAAGEPFR